MNQFDVYDTTRVRDSAGLLVLQGNRFLQLETVIIAPLFPAKRFKPLDEINPWVELNGQKLVAKLEGITAVPVQLLRTRTGNVSDNALLIQNALDRLFGGY